MPSRAACVAILLFWVYAAGGLLRRDILPDFWVTPPPDLRSIAAAEEDARPTAWELTVAEGNGLKGVRSVGRAVTRSSRAEDGGTVLVRPGLVRLREPPEGHPVRLAEAASGSISPTASRSTPRATSASSARWSALGLR